jgi:hypothetical protein
MNAVLEIRVDALEHAVNGNGNPGLKTRLALVEKDVADLGDLKARMTRVERAIWTAGGAIVGVEILLRLTH